MPLTQIHAKIRIKPLMMAAKTAKANAMTNAELKMAPAKKAARNANNLIQTAANNFFF